MTVRAPVRISLRTILMGGAALGLATVLTVPPWSGPIGTGVAFAQGQGGGGGGSSTHGSGSARGSGVGAPPSGIGSGSSGQAIGRGHEGQGGSTGTETGDEGTSTDKKGPQFGGGADSRKPASGTTGGKPVWAAEGIPEVELGRLSVARAPTTVLNHAFTEVTTNWATTGTTVMTLTATGAPTLTLTVAELYSKSAEEFARIVQTYYDSIVRIDSPLENLSLLKDVRATDATVLTGVTPASPLDLAAIFLGSASDKTIPVSADTVTAINTILQLPALTAAQTAELAAKADAVREAINIGHGE